LRKGAFDARPVVPNFQHQPALRRQVRRGFSKDAADQIQSVGTTVQRECRLPEIFGRQGPHHRFAHVRRIAEDDIVTFAGEPAEQVGAHQPHALHQLVLAHIAARNRQRRIGNIDAIDLCARKGMRGNDGKAAGTRAQIQYRLR